MASFAGFLTLASFLARDSFTSLAIGVVAEEEDDDGGGGSGSKLAGFGFALGNRFLQFSKAASGSPRSHPAN